VTQPDQAARFSAPLAATPSVKLTPSMGDVAQCRRGREYTLFRLSSGDGYDLGPAEGREAVHDGDADLDFGGLSTARQGIAQRCPRGGRGLVT